MKRHKPLRHSPAGPNVAGSRVFLLKAYFRDAPEICGKIWGKKGRRLNTFLSVPKW
ncbi:hypothetical protein HMPREF3038_01984 [Akkermansia sp. KLE1797]|nr:hypothetical protein HMPREF3038_01984 [Akkermansia sp. KLE1797]KXU54706.1 hypothetical protein HMPREF3039_01179 [Akkermansia sp. KLE1798]